MVPVLERCVTLGREFNRRQMGRHVKLLRELYAALKRGLPCANGWSEAFVDEWLQTLQLPPFEHDLELHAGPFCCATCNAAGATPSRRTELTFPGGARMTCDQCGRRWLERWVC